MSQFVEAQTYVTDPEDIIEALIELGILKDHIEVHDEPVPLSGYDRNSSHMAEIVVRKGNLDASFGDLGATRYKEGKPQEFFRFISDDMDCSTKDSGSGSGSESGLGRRLGRLDRRWGATHGGFLNHLRGRAAVIRAEKEFKRMGYNSRRVEHRNKQGHFLYTNVVAIER